MTTAGVSQGPITPFFSLPKASLPGSSSCGSRHSPAREAPFGAVHFWKGRRTARSHHGERFVDGTGFVAPTTRKDRYWSGPSHWTRWSCRGRWSGPKAACVASAPSGNGDYRSMISGGDACGPPPPAPYADGSGVFFGHQGTWRAVSPRRASTSTPRGQPRDPALGARHAPRQGHPDRVRRIDSSL